MVARAESIQSGRRSPCSSVTDVTTRLLGERVGQASALKLSYSAYQKASRVLAAVSYGLALGHGVDQELLTIADKRPGSYLAETAYIPKTAARAWRWAPELIEAADMLQEAGLPDDMLRAAAAILNRWTDVKTPRTSRWTRP